MDAHLIAKALTGQLLQRSRREDQHVNLRIGPHVAIGLPAVQLTDLAARPFVIQAELLGLDWGGLICIVDPASPHRDALLLARDARTVTAVVELPVEQAEPILQGRVAALEVGHFEGQPVDIFVFSEPTLEQLQARCGDATVLARPATT